jgi:hypothetical protein
MRIKRTKEEVDELLNDLAESVDSGERRFPGMSYEQGIEVGIRWLIGEVDDHPYEDA